MYPSKILLFGEYVILLKSNALSIPFYEFKGTWSFIDKGKLDGSDEQKRSIESLKKYLEYLRKNSFNTENKIKLDLDAFEKDLENGQYFKSDIPEGSGLGSSGALSAALFDKYSVVKDSEKNPDKIRNTLATLESFFHGSSSGIDPLTSYMKVPLLINSAGITTLSENQINGTLKKYGMFLVNSNQNGNTGTLVNLFNKRCKTDTSYLKKLMMHYIPENNRCISLIIKNSDSSDFFPAIRKISILQSDLFNKMIPGNFAPIIQHGIDHNLFYMKLCGSGGGGFFLGFTQNIEKTIGFFKNTDYDIIIF
ncbi:MAG: mevalonate kinase [Bacteroidia bacterium]|nr:mevalonate kinase [Bacteroidia bacterium]